MERPCSEYGGKGISYKSGNKPGFNEIDSILSFLLIQDTNCMHIISFCPEGYPPANFILTRRSSLPSTSMWITMRQNEAYGVYKVEHWGADSNEKLEKGQASRGMFHCFLIMRVVCE